MGIVTNYHNSIELLTNVSVTNPFDSKLQGWRSVEDALIFSNADLKIPDHAKWIIDYKDNPDTFNINSDFFRSDEFKTAHDGKHILFSGCSVTYGVGLYTKELWSHLLYNKIKNKEKVSGYYNLGTPGTGVFDIVFNIFKYIKNYGNPDVIFIDLPDLSRFYALINSSDQWVDTIPNNSLDYIKRNLKTATNPNGFDKLRRSHGEAYVKVITNTDKDKEFVANFIDTVYDLPAAASFINSNNKHIVDDYVNMMIEDIERMTMTAGKRRTKRRNKKSKKSRKNRRRSRRR